MKTVRLTPLSQPVTATVSVPGSKSYTNRALLLAALTLGPVKILKPLLSDDTDAMLGCLQGLGIETSRQANDIEVTGDISVVKDGDYELDAKLSGTTMRFMLALCAVLPGQQMLTGQSGLLARPVGDLVDGLRQLGASIEYLDREGYPPLRVQPYHKTASSITVAGGESSQYLSAILMIAPLVDGLSVEITGNLISRPYAAMTINVLEQFGIKVEQQDNRYRINGGQTYTCSEYVVEGDVSSASYFFAIAALTGSTLTVTNLNPHSAQADMEFLKILETMGSQVAYGSDEITVAGHGVKPIKVDMRSCPDQAQTLAVLATFADGATAIEGIESLRVKETERVKALQQELEKMAVKTWTNENTLSVQGGRAQAARIATYDDHRMAMAFAVAGSKLPGMIIEEPDVVTKTFPDFWQKLEAIGIGVSRSEI
ncbi:MAG TPA: 3-phosphoshikimate 1-carboxyvinyltransferase [Candidatus Saccharimonadales bacterium]